MDMYLRRLWQLMKLEGDGGSGGGEGGGEGDEGNKGNKGGADKTFTQDDLNRIATKEKGEGRTAALKELGFENVEDAKKWLETARKAEKDAMTETDRIKREKEEAEKASSAEKARADLLEQQVLAIQAGADPKTVADVVTLARNRITETVDFKAALEEVKKALPVMFLEGEEDDKKGNKGTGNPANPPRKPYTKEGVSGIGKRLAESKAAEQKKKNSYFTN